MKPTVSHPSDISDLITPPMPPGVDTGRPCDKYHDGSIKRYAVPAAARRSVALRYGAIPGETTDAKCQYCRNRGQIHWPRLYGGRPGAWVQFVDLSLDHVVPYSLGGCHRSPENLVLACKSCNSSKGQRVLADWLACR